MWQRAVVGLFICLLTALPALPQSSGLYTRAQPPEKALLERINLKTEWSVNLPIDGRKSALTTVQTMDEQLFVQTTRGLLIAIDILTGRIQWAAQLGTGDTVSTYPVAVNSQFVYAVNITKLYSFHRYTGAVEFISDLGSPPNTGLVADDKGVYCVLGSRAGFNGGQRLAVYNFPRPINIAQAAKTPQYDQNGKPLKDRKENPVDSLMTRYAPGSNAQTPGPAAYEGASRAKTGEAPTGGFSGSRTPSLATVPRVTPPYSLDNSIASPSLDVLPTLQQPYRIRSDTSKDLQPTPSIGTIPPSVAAALALSDLRPRPVQPELRWEFGSTGRILYPIALTPLRAWIFTDNQEALGINKIDKKVDVLQRLGDPISAAPGRAGLSIYVPLASGFLVDIEGSSSLLGGGAHIQWRTAVGGINNRTPFMTDTMVYAQGDNSGVVCVNRKTGEVEWRSDPSDDRILAANKDFLYVRSRLGKVQVYDAKRPTNSLERLSSPLAGIDLSEFNVPVTNTVSDRLLLASDNGLIVCLRDQSAQYVRPVRICPSASVNNVLANTVTSKLTREAPKDKDNPTPKDATEPKKEMIKQ